MRLPLDKFRHEAQKSWTLEVEPEVRPLLAAAEYSSLSIWCSGLAIGSVLGAAVLTAWQMSAFAIFVLLLAAIAVWASVRSRRVP